MKRILAVIAGLALLALTAYIALDGALPEALESERMFLKFLLPILGVTLLLFGLLVRTPRTEQFVQRSPEQVRADLLRGSVPREQVQKEAETLLRTLATEMHALDRHVSQHNLPGQRAIESITSKYHRAAGLAVSAKTEEDIDWFLVYAILSIADQEATDAWQLADLPREPLELEHEVVTQDDGNYIHSVREQSCPEGGAVVAGHCSTAGASQGYATESTSPDSSGGGDSGGGSSSD